MAGFDLNAEFDNMSQRAKAATTNSSLPLTRPGTGWWPPPPLLKTRFRKLPIVLKRRRRQRVTGCPSTGQKLGSSGMAMTAGPGRTSPRASPEPLRNAPLGRPTPSISQNLPLTRPRKGYSTPWIPAQHLNRPIPEAEHGSKHLGWPCEHIRGSPKPARGAAASPRTPDASVVEEHVDGGTVVQDRFPAGTPTPLR